MKITDIRGQLIKITKYAKVMMKYFLLIVIIFSSCKGEKTNRTLEVAIQHLEPKKSDNKEKNIEIIQKQEEPPEDCCKKNFKQTMPKDFVKRVTRIIPPWVRIRLIKEKIILSDNELKSFSLLDFNNDKYVDVIFVRNDGLLIFQKNEKTQILNEILDEDGENMDEFNWVDYFYTDDMSGILNYDKDINVLGQVLNLVKESSGVISIYYDGVNFKWVAFD